MPCQNAHNANARCQILRKREGNEENGKRIRKTETGPRTEEKQKQKAETPKRTSTNQNHTTKTPLTAPKKAKTPQNPLSPPSPHKPQSNPPPLNNLPPHKFQLPTLRRPSPLKHPPLTPRLITLLNIRHTIRRTRLTTMSRFPVRVRRRTPRSRRARRRDG